MQDKENTNIQYQANQQYQLPDEDYENDEQDEKALLQQQQQQQVEMDDDQEDEQLDEGDEDQEVVDDDEDVDMDEQEDVVMGNLANQRNNFGQQQVNQNENNYNYVNQQNQNQLPTLQGVNNHPMRPQSAKTAEEQLRFQNQLMYQQQQQVLPQNQAWQQQQQQNHLMPNGQILNQQATDNSYMTVGATNQLQQQSNASLMNQMPGQMQFGVQPNLFYPPQGGVQGLKQLKKRPTTANRKQQVQLGGRKMMNQQLSSGQNLQTQGQKGTTFDIEVSKMRPRIIAQERERLYDDVMKQKITANYFKDENIKLKTRILIVEGELQKKEKLIDDLLLQQEQFGTAPGVGTKGGSLNNKLKIQSHLQLNLKRKIKTLQSELTVKQDEIEAHKRNIKSTKISEIEVEMKMYMDECSRLRAQLEEFIRSKDTFADPEELKIIEDKFQQKDLIINQLRDENMQYQMIVNKKDDENRQLAMLVQDSDKQLKKSQKISKDGALYKKQFKEKEKELKHTRKELGVKRLENQQLAAKIEELNKRKPQLQQQQNVSINNQIQPQSSHSQLKQDTQANSQEVEKLNQKVEQKDQKIHQLNNVIKQLQTKLQDKLDELSDIKLEKDKFKDLYEEYSEKIAKIEVGLENGNLEMGSLEELKKAHQESKPSEKSKAEQSRHKSALDDGLDIVHANKMQKVDKDQIADAIQELKLKLQAKNITQQQIAKHIFAEQKDGQLMTVKEMMDHFENHWGFAVKKSLLLARYVIEPQDQSEVVFSEDNSKKQWQIVEKFKPLLGNYQVYNDEKIVQKMNEELYSSLKLYKGSLLDCLQVEDYDEIGILSAQDIEKGINNLELSSLTPDLMDYLLYFIYQRSESVEKMQYTVLFDFLEGNLQPELDQANNNLKVEGGNAASSNLRKRPESSSPEKLKARNKDKFSAKPSGEQKVQKQKSGSQSGQDEDEYGDDYEQEFEKLLDKDDEEEEDLDEQEESPKQLKEKKQKQEPQQDMDGDGDEDNYEEDDEDEVLDVAEKIFVRISEKLLEQKKTVRQVFTQYLIKVNVQGEDVELLSPEDLLNGIKDLEIVNLSELEIDYLLRVLSKQDLDGCIMLQELIVIMENFGLFDDQEQEGLQNETGLEGDQSYHKSDFDDQEDKTELDQEQSMQEADGDTANKKKGKKKEKQLDLAELDNKSIKILAKLMMALLDLSITLYEFFEGAIYDQVIKTKKKQNTVEILNAEDFFEILQKRGVRNSNEKHENLQKFLQLDPSYPHLLLLKKIAKTLDQMTKNEELMNAILGDPEDEDGNEQEDDYEEDNNQTTDKKGDQTEQNEKFLDNMRMLDEEDDSVNDGSRHLKTVKEIATDEVTQHATQDLKQKPSNPTKIEDEDYEEDNYDDDDELEQSNPDNQQAKQQQQDDDDEYEDDQDYEF